MSNIVYLTVTGEQQGSISAGCGTSESTGNRWQSGHEDEIFTFSLLNNINNTGLGSQFHGITFCKLIDKSTPLFINSINNNEQLFMGFDFYRINRFGRLEKYYYIQLRGAFLSAIHHQIIENQLDTETILLVMNLSSVNILSQIPSSAIWHSLKIITVCFYQIQKTKQIIVSKR